MHDCVRNGIDPVPDCPACLLLVLSAWRFEAKEPSGREPPWLESPE